MKDSDSGFSCSIGCGGLLIILLLVIVLLVKL